MNANDVSATTWTLLDLIDQKKIFKDNHVLDLACHNGHSSSIIKKSGAQSVTGIEVRETLVDQAKSCYGKEITFLTGDITDADLMKKYVATHDVVVALGVLYHLYDHFNFLSLILRPNVKHVILETLYGPESQEPGMFWGFESVFSDINGWNNEVDVIPHGTPNLSWILQVADLFGFSCDYVRKYYRTTNWDQPDNSRMVIRLFNRKSIISQSLRIEDIYEWNNDQLVIGDV